MGFKKSDKVRVIDWKHSRYKDEGIIRYELKVVGYYYCYQVKFSNGKSNFFTEDQLAYAPKQATVEEQPTLFPEIDDVDTTICQHENKYINSIGANCKFWVCPDCGADLGDA